MAIFNISSLDLTSSFENWYVKTNEIISAINQVNIVDVQAATNAGLEETFRGGGVVYLGVNPGSGITFANDGSLTLDASNALLQSRPNNNDRFAIVINPTTSPEVRVVSASNVLPSQINNDITFTGNISFSGDLSFITTGVVTLEANTQFEDKQLELAAKFRDVLTFATTASVTIGTTGYFYDKDTIGTTIASGTVSAIDTGNNEVSLSDVLFTTASDAWTNYTNSGATVGGEYLLKALDGTTIGRGLISRSQELEPRADQTAPIDADDAGLIVITSDPTTPVGGSAGHKKFTWRYNGATASSAWTSYEHLEVIDGKYLDTTLINPTGSQIDITSGSSTATLGFTDFTNLNDYFRIQHDRTDPGRTLVFSGNSNGAGAKTILTMVADGTMIAGTTALAQNLNADFLDGANGTTVGGTANTIPITNSSGRIDQTFIEGTLVVNEDITYSAHGFSAGSVIRKTPDGGYTLAKADSTENAEVIGVVQNVIDTNNFTLAYFGRIGISGFDVTLGYSTSGENDVEVTAGTVYYLSSITAGEITTSTPSDVGQIIKPIGIGIDTQEFFVTHYIGAEVFDVNDAVYAENLVPVGSIFYFGSDVTNLRDDFLICDGTLYSSANYPELSSVIKNNYYIPATVFSSNILALPTSDSNLRGLQVGSALRITYPKTGGGTGTVSATVSGVSAPSADVISLTIDTALAGFASNRILETKVYGSETGNTFFVPDLRGRNALGAGDSGGNRDSELGEILDGFGTSATGIYGQVSFTPVIRAKATADAFIATGHRHDDLYLRLDGGNNPTADINFNRNSIIGLESVVISSSSTETNGINTAGKDIFTNGGNLKTDGGDIETDSGEIFMNGGRIRDLGNPQAQNDAVGWDYSNTNYLRTTAYDFGTDQGQTPTQTVRSAVNFQGSMTFLGSALFQGPSTFSQNVTVPLVPVNNSHAASKKYVDDNRFSVGPNARFDVTARTVSNLENGIYYVNVRLISSGSNSFASVTVNGVTKSTTTAGGGGVNAGSGQTFSMSFLTEVTNGTITTSAGGSVTQNIVGYKISDL